MAARDYVLASTWTVGATPDEVLEILNDAAALPRWWGTVYLAVSPEPKQIWRVHSRGWLPYTLRWRFRPTPPPPGVALALEAWGDLEGAGEWRVRPLSPGETQVSFEWRVRADKPLLRYLSWLLKPVFAANHRWAMAQGAAAIRGEVTRRRLLRSAHAVNG